VQDDLGSGLETLRGLDVQAVLIEASGVARPARIASYADTWPGYRPGGIWVVVDAEEIGTLLADKFVGTLVREQIDQADVLLASRLDALSAPAAADAAQKLDTLLGRGWLRADRLTAADLSNLLGSAAGTELPTRARTSFSDEPHAAFVSMTVPLPRPLARDAAERLLGQLPDAVVRAKGWCRDDTGGGWLLERIGSRTAVTAFDGAPAEGALVVIAPAERTTGVELAQTLSAWLPGGSAPARR
jgi:G3E family GTPase